MKKVTLFLYITMLALITPLTAKADAIGTWNAYMAYGDITDIEPAGGIVYVLSSGSLFSYNVNDGSVETYNKANVLNDTDISYIAWCGSAKRLVIIYSSYNIDLLDNGMGVTNISDYCNKSMTDDKTINNITINGHYAYLSTGFGILKVNVRDAEISETYNLGMKVTDCAIAGSTIYARTPSGIYAGNTTDNLLDKGNWTQTSASVSFTDDNDITVSTAEGYRQYIAYDSANKCYWINQQDGKLQGYRIDDDGTKTIIAQGINPDGPASNNFYHIYIHNGKLYGVGGLWSQEKDAGRTGEVHVWNGTEWSEFEQPSEQEINHSYIDILCLDVDPNDNEHVMVGGKGGIYEFQNNKFINHYNKDNSNLASPFDGQSGYNYTVVTSLKYDDNGDLWILNPLVDNPIKKYSSNVEWSSYTHSEITGEKNFDLERLFISKNNGKMWFVNNNYNNSVLYSYDSSNDILELYGPDFINQDGENLGFQYIFSLSEDKEGNIWIGTNLGPLYLTLDNINNGSKMFTQHKVPRNDNSGYADYLLTSIDIRSIAIDGGNRKWIGTNSNGVFLISDDCNTQISHFTTDNSPLLSNIIQDIAIDGNTGTIYFATDKGLVSYTSDVTEPSESMDKDNVYAYPNPVRPEYTGQIAITGLSFNADVIITTSAGTLVNRGRSTGGTYLWDGKDTKGKRVASGVYMVQTATADGKKGTVCKIAVIN